MNDPEVARAVAVAEELERRKNDRARQSRRNAGVGCLLLIGLVIACSVITSRSGNVASTNDVSRYAQRVHDLFAVDAAGGREMAADAEAGNIAQAYAVAKQARDAMDQYRSAYAIDRPAGFDRTSNAVNAYIGEIRDRFDAAMKALDDPRPSTTVEMVEKAQLTYAKVVIDSFTSDLSHTHLSNAEKNRVMDRLLRGGK